MTSPRKRRAGPRLPNPYSPGSPGFAQRHAANEADIGGGVKRVDNGEPSGLVRDALSLKPNDLPKRQDR